jgi:hypothetical protein
MPHTGDALEGAWLQGVRSDNAHGAREGRYPGGDKAREARDVTRLAAGEHAAAA